MTKKGHSGLKGTPGSAKKKPNQAKKAAQVKIDSARNPGESMDRRAAIAGTKKHPATAAQTNKQISATELKTSTSRAIQAALKAPLTIVKNGQPVAVLISNELFQQLKRLEHARRNKGFPFDCAKDDPLINENGKQDEYFRAMTDQEVDDFIEGRY